MCFMVQFIWLHTNSTFLQLSLLMPEFHLFYSCSCWGRDVAVVELSILVHRLHVYLAAYTVLEYTFFVYVLQFTFYFYYVRSSCCFDCLPCIAGACGFLLGQPSVIRQYIFKARLGISLVSFVESRHKSDWWLFSEVRPTRTSANLHSRLDRYTQGGRSNFLLLGYTSAVIFSPNGLILTYRFGNHIVDHADPSLLR